MIPLFLSPIFGVSTSKFASEARGKKDFREFDFVVGLNFWLFLSVSLIFSGGFFFFIPTMASQFNADIALFYWGPIIILFTSTYLFFKRIFFVLDKFKSYALLETITAVLFFVLLILCIHLKAYKWLLLPLVIQLGIFSTVSFFLFYKHLMHLHWIKGLKHYREKLWDFFKYSMITGLGTALTVVSMHLFTLVLGGVADIRSVGYFALVRSTVEPANYLFRVITMVNFPKIAYIYGTGNLIRLKDYMQQNIKKFLKLISLAFIPAIFLSPFISSALFGLKHPASLSWLLASLLITYYLRTLSVFHVNFLSATRYPLIPNITGPLAVILVVPLIPVVFLHFGLEGLGILILTGELIRFTIVTVMGHNKLKKLA